MTKQEIKFKVINILKGLEFCNHMGSDICHVRSCEYDDVAEDVFKLIESIALPSAIHKAGECTMCSLPTERSKECVWIDCPNNIKKPTICEGKIKI